MSKALATRNVVAVLVGIGLILGFGSIFAQPATVSAATVSSVSAQAQLDYLGHQLQVITAQHSAIVNANANLQAQVSYLQGRVQVLAWQTAQAGGNVTLQAQLVFAGDRLRAISAESARVTNIANLQFAVGLLAVKVQALQLQRMLQ